MHRKSEKKKTEKNLSLSADLKFLAIIWVELPPVAPVLNLCGGIEGTLGTTKYFKTKMYSIINKCSTPPVLRQYSGIQYWHSTDHQYWACTCSRYCASTVIILQVSTEWRYHDEVSPVLFSTSSTGAVPCPLWISAWVQRYCLCKHRCEKPKKQPISQQQ